MKGGVYIFDKNDVQSNFVEERQLKIVELVSENKKISVPELCQYFNVSASTIRNDLRLLREANLITRTHGGAISKSKVSLEPHPSVKETQLIKEKDSIAKAAAKLVEDGDSIAIATGTTTILFAKYLLKKKNLTVLTQDIRIVSFLEEHTNFVIYMIGGVVRNGFHYINNFGMEMPNVCIDKIFLSCNGFSPKEGATVPDIQLAKHLAQIIKWSSETILLCDSSKFGGISFAKIAEADEIDKVIMDEGISDEEHKEFLKHCKKTALILTKL